MAFVGENEFDNEALRKQFEEFQKRTGQSPPYNTMQPGQEDPQIPKPDAPNPTATNATETHDSSASTANQPAPDTSKWKTDGYAAPKYTASNFGNAPAGFDATKWGSAEHQTPKYVVGRIMQEAAGGTGNLADPAKREAAIAKVLEAYPGAVYDGKDKITFPDGGTVDVFTGSSAGQYGIAWQPLTEAGGVPIPGAGGMPQTNIGGQATSTSAVNALTQQNTYDELLRRLQGILGAPSQDNEALMALMR